VTTTTMKSLRIGTRKSPLAMWQAEHIKARLLAAYPDIEVELVGVETKGDKILDVALAKVGGKGLFVKELEQALLDGSVDLCVHSTKDVPAELPEGTALVAFPPRADPRDCFAAPDGRGGRGGVMALPYGARVGTSSLRRQAQLLLRRPDLEIVPVRGNVATRLRKVDELQLSCVVLACAGLDRLAHGDAITHRFDVEEMLPAAGQGVLAIQARSHDDVVGPLLRFLDDATVRQTTLAERAFLRGLGGGCQVPIAAHAVVEGERLRLRGLVAHPTGRVVISAGCEGPVVDAEALGSALASDVRARGGEAILKELESLEVHA
jgi:hydroxymethylbilane synthase